MKRLLLLAMLVLLIAAASSAWAKAPSAYRVVGVHERSDRKGVRLEVEVGSMFTPSTDDIRYAPLGRGVPFFVSVSLERLTISDDLVHQVGKPDRKPTDIVGIPASYRKPYTAMKTKMGTTITRKKLEDDGDFNDMLKAVLLSP
jgi:hypothetical protein